MNIKELFIKEDKGIEFYKIYSSKISIDYDYYYDFSYNNLTSLEGLPENINKTIIVYYNNLKNLKGLPEDFNSEIWLNNNPIESLDGLNNVLNPKNIKGLKKDFIVSEYIRLGKFHLLV